jgi:hypothetical protein
VRPNRTRRFRRRIALLATLLVVPTAASLSDVAGHPIAADDSPSLQSLPVPPDASARGSHEQSLAPLAAAPSPAAPAATTVVAVRAGETIWSVAARSGVAPGMVLRHNRSLHSEPTDADTTADALASGGPLERAETLIVPLPPASGTRRVEGDGPRRDRPIGDGHELAALEPVFDRWADHFGVPRDLLKALAWVESGWDNDTRSSSGGLGIGRLQPLRARYLAEHIAGMALDPEVPVDNIALTAAQLRVLLDEMPDVRSAVAAHRQGITDTRLSGVDPLLDGYVDAVMTLRLRFA